MQIITSFCSYFTSSWEWWFLGIPPAVVATAYLALHVVYKEPKLVFVLFVFDIFAYFDDVSLWWVLGVPAAMLILFLWPLIVNKGRYRGDRYTSNESDSLLPYTTRQHVETLRAIDPSQSTFTSQSPIDTTSRVWPTVPDPSLHADVDPTHSLYSTPINSSSEIIDTRRLLDANPTSGPSTTVAGRQQLHVTRNSAREEVPGILLHESVTAQIDDRYPYDQQIKSDSTPFSTTRPVTGVFKCYNCNRKKSQPEEPRKWTSNGIFVEIWMSSTGHRYRTQLNSQKCIRCNIFVEPEVMKDDYVTKVVRVLDGWTGQHSGVKPLRHAPPTGPHKTDMCHACRKGICHQKPTK